MLTDSIDESRRRFEALDVLYKQERRYEDSSHSVINKHCALSQILEAAQRVEGSDSTTGLLLAAARDIVKDFYRNEALSPWPFASRTMTKSNAPKYEEREDDGLRDSQVPEPG